MKRHAVLVLSLMLMAITSVSARTAKCGRGDRCPTYSSCSDSSTGYTCTCFLGYKPININSIGNPRFCIKQETVTVKAVVLLSTGNVTGFLNITYDGSKTKVQGSLGGLTPGLHGIHVHQWGDLTGGCASAGPHWNPFSTNHGAPTDKVRHAGDLGNIQAGASGVAAVSITDKFIPLKGSRSVIGRAVVIHALADDLGKGGVPASLLNGNSGARVGCGVIALAP